jgi:dipeptidyl-peptidase-4
MVASFVFAFIAVAFDERPAAYVLPSTARSLVGSLQDAGARVEELREDLELDARAPGGAVRPTTVAAGSFVLRTGQTADPKAKELLQAFAKQGSEGSDDGPVLELPTAPPLHTSPALVLGRNRKPPQPFTLEVVFQGGDELSLDGDPITEIHWIDDERYLVRKQGPNGEALVEVEAQTGRSRQVQASPELEKALAKVDAIGQANAAEAARGRRAMNPQGTATLVEWRNDLYIAETRGEAYRLTATPGKEETPKFSPDGKFVAYVRENNLCVADLATRTERKLTTDGGGPIRNGKASWVYFEEFFDRKWDAFWWSPDSQHIAFLRSDEALTPVFHVINDIPVHQTVERTAYPKVGDPNPAVKIGVANVAGGVQWVDVPSPGGEPLVFPRVGWRNPKEVYFTAQNRTQTWMDLYVAHFNGPPQQLLHETTKAWVNYELEPKFLKDGGFVFPSERTGWKHLYLYDSKGRLVRAITSGEWEVRKFTAVDEAKGEVSFTGTKDNPISERPYKAKLDGSGVVAQSRFGGTTQWASVSPNGRYYVEAWSDHRTPTQAALFFADGRMARRIDTNPIRMAERFQTAPSEFVKIPTKDGFTLEGMVIRPRDFDEKKKYPVLVSTYGGPHSPTVRDNFGGGRVMSQMFAQQGMVVFRVDPRSASGKGAVSAWTAYKKLGVGECRDVEEAVAWLVAKYPFCDAARVGIEGTSYGGYLTAFCLTHSKAFAAGLAGAPVTDWHNYDSLYTERFMLTPAENPEGYKISSVVKAAGNLHGKLLLVHGMMDDNVHPQNTLQLAQELQKAGKLFEMMMYPTARHGGFDRRHYQAMRLDFLKRALGGPEEAKK